MCLDASLVTPINGSTQDVVVLSGSRGYLLPAQRQVGRRHDLDEVHEIVGFLVSGLFGVVQGIDVMVRPAAWPGVCMLLLHIRNDGVAQLGTETQVVDLVRKGMRFVLEIIIEVVDV